ncbi:hypothetical protein [Apilactobacillus ozensis]|uniref:hypothetical protein n=1 Tax=Apilactobacillus ozensis TaxID=866801 RepID=UPI002093C97A|nr:hypothetical protein [Apilactobacillus ozensis]
MIKKWFKLNKDSQLSTKMYRLLYTFAESMNDDMAWQLMTTLTGHAKVALTADQQSKYLNTTILQLYFRQIDMFCVLLKFIKSSNEYNFFRTIDCWHTC